MGFKDNLKAELAYQDILVKELAARTGMSKHTIDNYLNVREYTPSAESAVKIARALGVSVEYLVTGEDTARERLSFSAEIHSLVHSFKLLPESDRKMILAIVRLFRNRPGSGIPAA
ncbi:MAG: helix-turn-helix domain-containing protein [Spirochaetaceae bacterium]|jgi:transcriptional regulator with XRE-family HTH domain|nr:helix-turn-helix domain-containing protein [Spirochaetaceae bacterium]